MFTTGMERDVLLVLRFDGAGYRKQAQGLCWGVSELTNAKIIRGSVSWPYHTMPYLTIHTVPYLTNHIIPTLPYHTLPTIPYHTILCHTIQHYIKPYPTIPCSDQPPDDANQFTPPPLQVWLQFGQMSCRRAFKSVCNDVDWKDGHSKFSEKI